MEKRISFILPGVPYKCTGGQKVIFEYANELVKRNYSVEIYFYIKKDLEKTRAHLPLVLWRMIAKHLSVFFPKASELNRSVKRKEITSIDNFTIRNGDFIFATAVDTAYPVSRLADSKGKKYYFIQDYEAWDEWNENMVESTYKLMNNIVISKWLKDIVDRYSNNPSILISNAINNSFYLTNKVRNRNPLSICALYHERIHKGFKYTWSVIKRLKKKYPSLKVTLFGMYKCPKWMPKWVNYFRNASYNRLRTIYNESGIIICSSINEGFGLTGAEALACGCVLASSDYSGIHEYAIDGYNCLLSPCRDTNKLFENVVKLIENDNLRIRLALNGLKSMHGRTWKKATRKLIENILN